jgi:hypothetical protein
VFTSECCGSPSQILELTDPISGSISAKIGDTVTIKAIARNYNGYEISQWGTPSLLSYVSHSSDLVISDTQEISTAYRVVAAGSAQIYLKVMKDGQMIKQVKVDVNCYEPGTGKYTIAVKDAIIGVYMPNIEVYLVDNGKKGKIISKTGVIDKFGIAQISITDVPSGSVTLGADACMPDIAIPPVCQGQRNWHGENIFNFDGVPEYKGEIKLVFTSECCNQPPIDRLYWGFDKDLDSWERTGTVPPWNNMEGGIKWHDRWGGAQGVILLDACESTPSGYQAVHAKPSIKKTITIPQNANIVIFNVVQNTHDSGIRFLLTDSEGQHILGEEILSGVVSRELPYDISVWRGKTVTLEVQGFGAGTDDSGCVGSPHGCGSCCGEFPSIDSVTIN